MPRIMTIFLLTAILGIAALAPTCTVEAESDRPTIRDDTSTQFPLGHGFENRFSGQTKPKAIQRLERLRAKAAPVTLDELIRKELRTVRVVSYSQSSGGSPQDFADVKSRIRNALNSIVLHPSNTSYHPTLTPPDTWSSPEITAWIVLENRQTCRLEIGPPEGYFFFQDAHGISWWHRDVLLHQYLAVTRLWKRTTGQEELEYKPITRNDLNSYSGTWKGKGRTSAFELRLNEDGTWVSHFKNTGIERINEDGTRTPVGQTGRTGYWYLYKGVFLLRDAKLGMDPQPDLGPLLLLNEKGFSMLALKETPSGFVPLKKANQKD